MPKVRRAIFVSITMAITMAIAVAISISIPISVFGSFSFSERRSRDAGFAWLGPSLFSGFNNCLLLHINIHITVSAIPTPTCNIWSVAHLLVVAFVFMFDRFPRFRGGVAVLAR
jgi:hypothetical protein